MISETASPATRVSGRVDQFPHTKRLNPLNERNHIRSNQRGSPADDCNRAPTSEKLQLEDHINPERVNSGRKPQEITRRYTSQLSYIVYNQIELRLHSSRQQNRRERTYGGGPAQSKLTSGREEGEDLIRCRRSRSGDCDT